MRFRFFRVYTINTQLKLKIPNVTQTLIYQTKSESEMYIVSQKECFNTNISH